MNRAEILTKYFSPFVALLLYAVSVLGQPAVIPLPTANLANDEFRFAAIGDSGTGKKPQRELARQLVRVQADTSFSLLLLLGDNLYESGSPKDIEKKFLVPYSPLFLRGVEFRGVIGNHDARNANGVLLQKMIFNMGVNSYYSFSKGDRLVDFFGVDTTFFAKTKNLDLGKIQAQWLEEKLAASKARWKISFMHHPLYSSSKRHGFEAGDEKQMLRVRENIEPILVKHGVQISLHGHDHVYERTKRIKNIQYFVSGAAGKLRKGNLQKDSPFYEFGNDQVLSFMLFSVKPEEVTFWSIGIAGNILDSGRIEYSMGEKN